MSLNSLAASRALADERKHNAASTKVFNESADVARPEDLQNALSALVEYLPTETVSLYLATLAALSRLNVDGLTLFIGFGLATPVLYFLVYCGKRRARGLPSLPPRKEFPWWPLVASTIAFFAWAQAMPGNPVITAAFDPAIHALIAVAVSTVLGVVGRVVGPPGQ